MIESINNLPSSDSLESEAQARIRLVRTGCIISLMALAFHVFVNISAGQWIPVYVSAIPTVILIIGLFFNQKGYYAFGMSLVFIGFGIYFPFQHYLFGNHLGMTPVFIVMVVSSIVVLEGHKHVLIITTTVILLSYGLSRYIAENFESSLVLVRSKRIEDIYFVLSCLLCIILLSTVLRLKRRYLDLTKDLLIDVNRKNETLKLQNDELENFAFATSHDLKTPLRNINSFVGLIENRLKDTDDPTLTEYINIVKNGSSQMSSIIDNILSLSSIDKDSEVEEFSLSELMDSLLFNYTDPINNGVLKIEYSELPNIKGLKKEMSVLLMNLIDNGIKYNAKDVAVIEVSAERLNQSVKINISDNGIGIDPEYHELIFKPFKRLYSEQEYKGTGLGLAIVKKVVDSHNGSIHLESGSEGSTFSIVLPD